MKLIRKFFQRFVKNMTEPMGLSVLPIAVIAASAAQMTQWHWISAGDWRGWAGFLCAWIAAYILEAIIGKARGWLAQRARRKAAAP